MVIYCTFILIGLTFSTSEAKRPPRLISTRTSFVYIPQRSPATMPSIERDDSRDSARSLRHQHSISSADGSSRAIVPMCVPHMPLNDHANKSSRWDSADPERAPPPLPMNPSSSSVASRPNTSSAIQSAHAALTEKARESSHITNVSKRIEQSPERSLIKGAAHKRMQSLQTGSVRDLSNLLEGASQFSTPRSPEKSESRSSFSSNKDSGWDSKSPEKDSSRSGTPTPSGRDSSSKDTPTPSVRPSLRKPPQSILGENTPPQSATMLALQNMPSRDIDMPLSNITNSSTALVRTPQTFDAISNQILSLTSICTNLQREMAQLSRRSKDNATDLVSLKEATNARDEDIRKSLRELVTNISDSPMFSSNHLYGGNSGLFIDNKAHNSPNSRMTKGFSLPRIPSPNSFAASLDRETLSTPSVYNADHGASIALLEKILREMGTKEGQENLLSRLSEVASQLPRDGIASAKKLDNLDQWIKDNTTSKALVAHNGGAGNNRAHKFSFEEPPRLELDFDHPRSGPGAQRVDALISAGSDKENRRASGRVADIVNEDILKIIRTVKDSVAQGGGLTAEVKALVRELRGEVLGMGRDIGRQLDKAHKEAQTDKTASTKDVTVEKEHLSRIVQGGLDELKHHMDRVVRENRRESASSTTSKVDYQEIYNAVRTALNDRSKSTNEPNLSKKDIILAVREAWEMYKPEVEVNQSGLEREELLAALKEGIEEFAPQHYDREHVGATRDEVFSAVVEAFKHFSPPPLETEASLSRDEILDAVRQCLEEFEFPSASVEHGQAEITREDVLGAVEEGMSKFNSRDEVLDAVREGLSNFNARDDVLNAVPEALSNYSARDDVLEALREGMSNFNFQANTAVVRQDIQGISRDDVFDAVRAGMENMPMPTESMGAQVYERLQEILDTLRAEFQAVSDEAKENVSANGRDTEQVLDATKDGFDKLRADIETYVDRAADVTGKDEILSSMRESFDVLRAEVAALAHKNPEGSLDAIQLQFEHLRETMATSVGPRSSGLDKEQLLGALREGLDGLRADIDRPKDSNESILSGTSEILDALQDGLNSLRIDVEKIGNKPVDMTVNYEILDTLKAGLESVRADIDRLHESQVNDRAVAPIEGGAVIAAEGLKRNDIENLEVLITQLRIKVEALESMPPPPPQPMPGSMTREDLTEIEESLRSLQVTVAEISARGQSSVEDGVAREDVEAIETLLRNTKAKIDEMDPEQAVKKDHLDSVEAMIFETRENVSGLANHLDDVTKRDEMLVIESLVKDVLINLEEMKERAAEEAEDVEKVTKVDFQAVEAVCLDLKSSIETTLMSDIADLASKHDVKNLGEIVKEFKGRIETHAEINAKAFEERQAETVGVGERVAEVKTFLEEFKLAVKEKLDEGATGVESLGKLLESMSETISQNAGIHTGVKELFETIRIEFEKSNAGVVGAKLETEDKFQQTWDRFDGKMDEKFNELMTKYDDAELAAEAKAKVDEEKNAETEATLLSTKQVAEDLRLLIDTLGTSITESVDKMDEASKTVFNRVEDTFTRVEETHADAKSEHQLTREQVFKVHEAINGVEEHATEFHPKILESVKDVLLIVGQHYEHSKTSTATIQEKIAERPAPAETPLLEPPVVEKYDDAQVHEKLDKLVDHMHVAGKSFSQLDTLEKIHQQVLQTAAEVSEFVSAQKQRIQDDHEDKEREAEKAVTVLEKCFVQKDQVEATVVGLREEEERLKASVAALKAEQDDLAHRKMRLSADVSSFETALRIRREELHAMESRAEGLERRILEGVIDHSRALLISNSNKGREAMSRKRVPSHATSTTGSMISSANSKASYTSQSAVSMALNGNRGNLSVPINNPAGSANRRILSLNQITNNVPTGGSVFKRSHSVKAPNSVVVGGLRKSSWGGSLSQKYGELNKENLALKESEEEDGSENGTEMDDGDRRMSRGTTIMTGRGTMVSDSIDEGTEWTESVAEDDDEEEGQENENGGAVQLYEPEGEVV